MSSLVDSYVRAYANALADEGEKALKRAFATANFKKDKTQNLHDSYGCAVYYNGRYVYGTKRVLSPRATKPKYNTYTGKEEYGREEINQYLDSYKPKSKGFELVVVAAMFYGVFLEKGSGHLRKKYRVVSGMNSYLEALAAETNGKIVNINL